MKRLSVVLLAMASVARAADAPDPAAIFKANCAMCHGTDGKGQTVMGKSLHLKDLGSAEVQKQSDEAIENVVKNGKGKMPAYSSKLSEAEIDSLVKFIRTFKK